MNGPRMLWRSETKAVNVTNPQPIELTSPLSPVGPNGGRMVIDVIVLVVQGTITVATANWDGRDVPGLVSTMTVEQQDGTPRVQPISGRAHRLATFAQVGPERYNEHPTVAIGAAQAVDLRLPIHFWRPKQRRPHDYSLGVEMFRRLLWTPNSLAAAATSTTVLSAATLNCSLEIWGHEESDCEHKALDAWQVLDFTSGLQVTAQLVGPLQELFLVSTAASAAASVGGGALITAVTDVRVDQLGIPPLLRATALAQYRWSNRRGNTSSAAVAGEVYGDPITEGRVWPILPLGDELMPPWQGWTGRGQPLKVDINPSTASIQLLARCAVPKSANSWNLTNKTFRIVDTGRAKVKTSNGNAFAATRGEMAYAVMSVPLPSPMKRLQEV